MFVNLGNLIWWKVLNFHISFFKECLSPKQLFIESCDIFNLHIEAQNFIDVGNLKKLILVKSYFFQLFKVMNFLFNDDKKVFFLLIRKLSILAFKLQIESVKLALFKMLNPISDIVVYFIPEHVIGNILKMNLKILF